MSSWTNIHAQIDVDFGNQTDYWIRDFFDNLRKDKEYMLSYEPAKKGDGFEITGSELNAVVVAEPLRNHVLDGRDRYWHGQRYSITVSGALRDREIEDTIAEWNRFFDALKKFVKECEKVSGSNYDYDSTVTYGEILYFNVDITSPNDNKRYHKCSLDEEEFEEYIPGKKNNDTENAQEENRRDSGKV